MESASFTNPVVGSNWTAGGSGWLYAASKAQEDGGGEGDETEAAPSRVGEWLSLMPKRKGMCVFGS
jgi:hypothetical protein